MNHAAISDIVRRGYKPGAGAGSAPHVVLVEVKLAERWDPKWNRAMRELDQTPGIHVERMVGVYMGRRSYRFNRIQVLPLEEFLQKLHRGYIF